MATSLGGLLSIARSSLLTNQSALGLVTGNTANANTPGYARRDVRLASLAAGSGVGISAVMRRTSPFLAQQLLGAAGQLGAHQAKANGLTAIETSFGDDQYGLGARLDALFAGLRTLATDPADGQLRNDVIARGQAVCDSFSALSERFASQRRSTDEGIGLDVEQVNQLAAEIARENDYITASAPNSDDRASHQDTRDQLVGRLADLVEISTIADDNGSLTVLLQGGNALVSGESAGRLRATPDAALGGMRRIDLVDASGSALDVTSMLRGGSIGGALELRDEILTDGATRIDQLAYDIATSFNAVHSAGYGTDGATGRDFFTNPTQVTGAAASMTLAAGMRDNPAWVAGASDAASAVGGGGNVLALIALADANNAAGNTATYGQEVASLVGDFGRMTKAENDAAEGGSVRLEQVQALYDSDTGVSMDEELIDLQKYERAYQAGARILSTVDQMYETLLRL
ncbi:MAG TPA: flagellar hook-associated protein FlgK [Nannocystaceae bacterium]|nr:flagellar hook-associated protein FlgK [Nannocystaceae bacterium]